MLAPTRKRWTERPWALIAAGFSPQARNARPSGVCSITKPIAKAVISARYTGDVA